MRFDSVNFLVLQRLNPSVISLLGRIHMGAASIFSDPGSIVICIDFCDTRVHELSGCVDWMPEIVQIRTPGLCSRGLTLP